MEHNKLIEPIGFVVAGATFLYSFFLFYYDTAVFGGSLAAALLAAGLMWMTYVILRLVMLTIRK